MFGNILKNRRPKGLVVRVPRPPPPLTRPSMLSSHFRETSQVLDQLAEDDIRQVPLEGPGES
jgi:hypothetical protein